MAISTEEICLLAPSSGKTRKCPDASAAGGHYACESHCPRGSVITREDSGCGEVLSNIGPSKKSSLRGQLVANNKVLYSRRQA